MNGKRFFRSAVGQFRTQACKKNLFPVVPLLHQRQMDAAFGSSMHSSPYTMKRILFPVDCAVVANKVID